VGSPHNSQQRVRGTDVPSVPVPSDWPEQAWQICPLTPA